MHVILVIDETFSPLFCFQSEITMLLTETEEVGEEIDILGKN